MTEQRWKHYPGGVQCIGCTRVLLQYAWTTPNGPICSSCRWGDDERQHRDTLDAVARELTAERFQR